MKKHIPLPIWEQDEWHADAASTYLQLHYGFHRIDLAYSWCRHLWEQADILDAKRNWDNALFQFVTRNHSFLLIFLAHYSAGSGRCPYVCKHKQLHRMGRTFRALLNLSEHWMDDTRGLVEFSNHNDLPYSTMCVLALYLHTLQVCIAILWRFAGEMIKLWVDTYVSWTNNREGVNNNFLWKHYLDS